MQAILWDANASFSSNKSISVIFKPARSNAFCVAGTGPIPIIAGSTPATAMLTIFAIGFKLYFFTAASLASNMAAAPSLIPLLLPAVTVPSFKKAGFNVASFSTGESLGCSSFSNNISALPCIIFTATISSLNFSALFAASYFIWLAAANSS